MNKKIITRILVALAAYGVFVALVVNFYDDSPAKMQWEDREAYNRQFIAKLELESFNFNSAIEQLGSPDITEAKLVNDSSYLRSLVRRRRVRSISPTSSCSASMTGMGHRAAVARLPSRMPGIGSAPP